MQSCEGKSYTPFQTRAFPLACVLEVYTSLLWGRTVGLELYFSPLNKESILQSTFKLYLKSG